jgi:hypothetical protein
MANLPTALHHGLLFFLRRGTSMSVWIVKTETYDPDLALEIVQDQQAKGYTAWIEDEHGKAVDEEALRMHKAEPTKPTLAEKWKGLLVVLASAAVAIGILYVAGLWVDGWD